MIVFMSPGVNYSAAEEQIFSDTVRAECKSPWWGWGWGGCLTLSVMYARPVR